MSSVSRPVNSDQSGPHPDLAVRVERHRRSGFLRPTHGASAAAFAQARTWLAARSGVPVVLDTGCGTGTSSHTLAHQHPETAVIGIDKSAVRLARGATDDAPDNLLLLQANLLDFYPLARAAGWQASAQYLLYPNPWPKAAQLNKRWHGSPIFPDLIALGGTLELRSNWRVYVDEMRLALSSFDVVATVERFEPVTPLTRFEAKYAASGHALWRLQADLCHAAATFG